MKNVFFGLIFIIFTFRLNLGIANLDILPDFIGFYLLMDGLKKIYPSGKGIAKLLEHTKIAFGFSIFSFAFSLFGIFTMMGPTVSAFFELIGTGLMVYAVHGLIDIFLKTEKDRGTDLNAKNLERIWNINTCVLFVAILSGFVPNYPVISLVSFFVSFVISVVFMFAFSKTKKAWTFAKYC